MIQFTSCPHRGRAEPGWAHQPFGWPSSPCVHYDITHDHMTITWQPLSYMYLYSLSTAWADGNSFPGCVESNGRKMVEQGIQHRGRAHIPVSFSALAVPHHTLCSRLGWTGRVWTDEWEGELWRRRHGRCTVPYTASSLPCRNSWIILLTDLTPDPSVVSTDNFLAVGESFLITAVCFS